MACASLDKLLEGGSVSIVGHYKPQEQGVHRMCCASAYCLSQSYSGTALITDFLGKRTFGIPAVWRPEVIILELRTVKNDASTKPTGLFLWLDESKVCQGYATLPSVVRIRVFARVGNIEKQSWWLATMLCTGISGASDPVQDTDTVLRDAIIALPAPGTDVGLDLECAEEVLALTSCSA